MKKTSFDRLLGVLLLAGAALGIIISLSGVLGVWIFRPILSKEIQATIDTSHATLTATDDMLAVFEDSISNARESLGHVQDSIDIVSQAIEDTSIATQSFSTLVGTDLVDIITQTRAGLESMQQTALLMDNTLTFIASLPIIGSLYQPEVPLNVSILNIADDMAGMPEALLEVSGSLDRTTHNLADIQESVSGLSASMEEIQENLTDAGKVINKYQAIIHNLEKNLDRLEKSYRITLFLASIALTLFFIWMLLAQTSLSLQGWDRMKNRRQED